MKKIILIVLSIGLLAAAFYGYMEYQRKVPEVSQLKTDYKLTANELFEAFEMDEVKANEKYIGKVIELTGIIDLIEVSEESSSITLLADNAMIGGVNCQMQKDVDFKNIEEGEEITIKGICQGFLMSVIINRAILLDKE